MLLIVGNPDPVHVGAHLKNAAARLAIDAELVDVKQAADGPVFLRKLMWRLGGHRPYSLKRFSASIKMLCEERRPELLLATGICPITAADLHAIREFGVTTVNFLTDDPWNPAHHAPWFMSALSEYDFVFSPRRSNLADLKSHGCRNALFLPFAYSAEVHFPETALDGALEAFDVVFVGGADRDRVPLIAALLDAGISIKLFGGYWDRYKSTRSHYCGFASPQLTRQLARDAKVSLCLVRRANRDGHCMRSFELAAMGACIIAEDSGEHREIFGPEGTSAIFFRETQEMIFKIKALLNDPDQRLKMRALGYTRIASGGNSYSDRLEAIMRTVSRHRSDVKALDPCRS